MRFLRKMLDRLYKIGYNLTIGCDGKKYPCIFGSESSRQVKGSAEIRRNTSRSCGFEFLVEAAGYARYSMAGVRLSRAEAAFAANRGGTAYRKIRPLLFRQNERAEAFLL